MTRTPTSAAPRSASRQGGFTLIELLVVMIIIAILMAVAVPTFLAEKSRARKTQIIQNFHNIELAIQACSLQNTDGSYAGCADWIPIWKYEPTLGNLPICCATPEVPANAYDINAIDGSNTIIWWPDETTPYSGFETDTWMQDGGKKIWFQFAHWPDGTITRKCGEGNRPTFTKTAEPGVPGSRVCRTGKW